MTAEGLHPRRAIDPRIYQILTLASLLVYGIARLDLEVQAGTAFALLATALLTHTPERASRASQPSIRRARSFRGFPSASFCAPTLSAGRSSPPWSRSAANSS